MSWLHLVILSPFLLAFFVPLLYRKFQRIHTGWFVLPLPLVLFIYFTQYISGVSKGETYLHSMKWIPSLGINFDAYVDGLGLLFSLLITGIGTLVILYSIYYLSKTKEALHSFYVYLLLFPFIKSSFHCCASKISYSSYQTIGRRTLEIGRIIRH